jgi:hypothetical protein
LELSGGNRRHRRSSRIGAATLAVWSLLALAACGGGSSSDTDEVARTYPVTITKASFPGKQRLGETTLMRLGVRNAGERPLPALTVTVSVAGEEGGGSTLPFGIRDPQPGLSQPDRPVWVLSEHYPKLAGSDEPGGAESAGRKTFVFGKLDPGATTEAIWKVTASRTGDYTIRYRVGAGLGGKARAETAGGGQPAGTFPVTITEATPNLSVTDSGEVVEVGERKRDGR